jgi:exportin-1
MPYPNFRSLCVQCLVEISSIDIESEPKYGARLDIMFRKVMNVLTDQLPLDVDMAHAYANGSNEEQQMISNLAQFLSTYLRKHSALCEIYDAPSEPSRQETKQAHELALKYLLKISEVEDTEVFKVCNSTA